MRVWDGEVSEVFIFNQNKQVFNVKLEHVNVGLTISYKIKLLVLYIYIYIWVRSGAILCSFFIIQSHTVLHDAVQFTTTYGSSMQLLYFAGSFVWFGCSHTIWWTLLMTMIIIINESLHSISKLYKMVWHCRLADGFLWQNGKLNHLSESGWNNFSDSCAVIKTGKSKGNGRWTESTDILPEALLFFLRFTQGWKGRNINGL